MLCTKIHLSERRYRNPPEQNDGGPVVRPCSTRELPECITPRTSVKNQRSAISQQLKTPLVIFSLCIAPDTVTLAPKDIKRDPRKPPPYCQNFKICSNATTNFDEPKTDSLDFFIKGTEIGSQINNDGRPDDDNLNEIRQIDCSCDDTILLPDIEMNLNGYEMDNFGHLPGDSRTPTPSLGARCKFSKRPPSPMTEQVIRITMNSKPAISRTLFSKKYR